MMKQRTRIFLSLLTVFLCLSASCMCEETAPSHPYTITELIDIGLQNNPTTKEAWANARAAAGGLGIARSSLYPSVFANGALSAEYHKTKKRPKGSESSRSYSGNSRSSAEAQLVVHYLLFDFGGRSGTIKAACETLRAADWIHDQSIQDVIIGILQAYYNYLSAEATEKAKNEDVKNAKTVVDSTEHHLKAGVSTRLDLLLAQSNLMRALLDQKTALGQTKITLGELANAIGIPANTPLQVAKLPGELPTEQASRDMDILIEIAKETRSDLAARRATVRQREAEVRVAQSEHYPTITADFDTRHINYFRGPLKEGRDYHAVLSLNFPIFEGFRVVSKVRQAKALRESAYQAWQKSEDDAILTVLTNYNNFQTAKDSLKFSEEFLKYSQEAYEASLLSYRTGAASILDLLVAQSALANARAQLIEAKTSWISSLSQLAYSTGLLNIPKTDMAIFHPLENLEKCSCD